MNDTVTILGRVGGDPNRRATSGGVPVVNFRVASPQSRYDSKTQTWIETGTNWYTVSAFRQLAEHAKASLRTGDGVIVTGRLKLREWESGGKKGMSADIDAEAIGHDLRWGASAYLKARTSSSASTSESDSSAESSGENAETEEAAAATFNAADAGLEAVGDARDETVTGDQEPDLVPAGGPWQ